MLQIRIWISLMHMTNVIMAILLFFFLFKSKNEEITAVLISKFHYGQFSMHIKQFFCFVINPSCVVWNVYFLNLASFRHGQCTKMADTDERMLNFANHLYLKIAWMLAILKSFNLKYRHTMIIYSKFALTDLIMKIIHGRIG